jgi:hypothetical protein
MIKIAYVLVGGGMQYNCILAEQESSQGIGGHDS